MLLAWWVTCIGFQRLNWPCISELRRTCSRCVILSVSAFRLLACCCVLHLCSRRLLVYGFFSCEVSSAVGIGVTLASQNDSESVPPSLILGKSVWRVLFPPDKGHVLYFQRPVWEPQEEGREATPGPPCHSQKILVLVPPYSQPWVWRAGFNSSFNHFVEFSSEATWSWTFLSMKF